MHNVSLEQSEEIPKEEVQNLTLPNNWWSKNYSCDYYPKENNSEIQILKFEPSLNDEVEFDEIHNDISELVNSWDYSQGDYYVNPRNYQSEAKSQKLNSLLSNNFLFIGIVFAVVITLIVLNIVVSL